VSTLTPRERQIVSMVAEGRSNREIAAALSVAESTVKNHLQSVFKKLQIKSRAQLIVSVLRAVVAQ
jgi:DNA-binding CsgD family transcriptional regulator